MMKNTINNNRVAMLVWNTFQHDARVLNEAKTLSFAGFHVTVNALHAPGITKKCQRLCDNLYVERHGRFPGLHQIMPRKNGRRSIFGIFNLALLSVFTQLTMVWSVVRSRPDVIHAHDVNMLVAAWIASLISRAPLIYDAHEISAAREGYVPIRGAVGLIEKIIMPKAIATITTTDARAKFFSRAYGIARPLVLQNRPRKIKIDKNENIRDQLKLSEAWPIILYQGGLQQGRGLSLLMRAAHDVPNAYFVFIGSGRQQTELYAIRDQLDLKERVHFIPAVPLAELPVYTASADIGVQPIENTCLNHFTTDSNKLFEYVMAGLPVVASRLPEISKIVNDYSLGLLVTPGDIYELTDALTALVNDSSMRQLYAENSLKAAGELCWETQESNLIELYNKVIKQYE